MAMSEASNQFLLMVRLEYEKLKSFNREGDQKLNRQDAKGAKKSVVRRMFCEVCGRETEHVLEANGEWEVLRCGCGVGHYYRVK